jgi:DNA-binding MarR family transcriptional regulator
MSATTRSRLSAERPEPLDVTSAEARVGVAWRELRRGVAMQAMRERLYGDLLEPAQVDALDVVVHQQGCRMRDLADGLRVDPSTATRVVDRLDRAGLVRRVSERDDGRRVRVEVTPAGRRLHAELSARRRVMLLGVLEGFDPDEREILAELLERLIDGVDRYVSGAVDEGG